MAVLAVSLNRTYLLWHTASSHGVNDSTGTTALGCVETQGCRIPTVDDDSAELQPIIQFQYDRLLVLLIVLVHFVSPFQLIDLTS
jgi:hypothetical protein